MKKESLLITIIIVIIAIVSIMRPLSDSKSKIEKELLKSESKVLYKEFSKESSNPSLNFEEKNNKQTKSISRNESVFDDVVKETSPEKLRQFLLRFNVISQDLSTEDILNLKELNLSRANSEIKLSFKDRQITDEEFIQLSQLTELKSLTLDAFSIKDISPLAALKKLEELKLSAFAVDDISSLAELDKLRKLELSVKSLTLDALSGLNDLRDLRIYSNKLNDISGIEGLVDLRSLNLHSEVLDNVDALRSLDSLQSLFLSTKNVSDISAFEGMKALEFLTLFKLSLEHIDSLGKLPKLQSISLNESHLKDFSGIENSVSITQLDINSSTVQDLSAISLLPNLRDFRLADSDINNLSFIAETKIDSLEIYRTQVSDIGQVTQLKHLKRLTTDSEQFTDEDLGSLKKSHENIQVVLEKEVEF